MRLMFPLTDSIIERHRYLTRGLRSRTGTALLRETRIAGRTEAAERFVLISRFCRPLTEAQQQPPAPAPSPGEGQYSPPPRRSAGPIEASPGSSSPHPGRGAVPCLPLERGGHPSECDHLRQHMRDCHGHGGRRWGGGPVSLPPTGDVRQGVLG